MLALSPKLITYLLSQINQEDTRSMSFAFSTADMVLSPINEGALAHAAEKELIEISALLGKLKTGTATRDEKCRLDSLNAKLDGLKNDIEASPRRSWNCLH